MKQWTKKFAVASLAAALAISLPTALQAEAREKIRIGCSPSPHAEILEHLKPDFEAAGLDVEVVVFTDYDTPNRALDDGDIDANYFQHVPYLEDFCEKNQLNLEVLCGVHLEPMAVFSARYKSLDEVQEGDEVFIPNDTVNGARALLILQAEGLIELDPKSGLEATEKDIIKNEKKLKFRAMDAVQIPHSYEDAALAVINGNYAIENGLDPIKDSVAIEGKSSPYVNVVAVRKGEVDKEAFVKLKKVLLSDKVSEFIKERYDGAVVAAAYDPETDKLDSVKEDQAKADAHDTTEMDAKESK
ncbi:MAG: MetQ/NlpA family ABC transporter substrate-binding protein [Eubacteriales bacterium]|nr:MetQ/NlpA family ABC transporter substrate-binding protein [Eubacteriales bacterium]